MPVISDIFISAAPPLLWLRRPLFWILVVGLLAMGGSLRADFYMDDYGFILNSKGDAPNDFAWSWGGKRYGSEAIDAMDVSVFQLIPTGMTLLTNSLFPLNPMAAHFWNLLIHLTLAVLVFVLGTRLLKRLDLLPSPQARSQAAFVGALIFACHPLGTEPVHYAKCHMVQLVALFSFWATCEAMEFIAAPNLRRGGRFLFVTGLCIISYFPGTVLLSFNLLALLLFMLSVKGRTFCMRHLPPPSSAGRRRILAIVCLGILVGALLADFFLSRFYHVVTFWGDLYPVHLVTQGRVFWEYMLRVFIPTGLASDHYQPWSTFRDPHAMIKLTALAVLFIGTIVMAFRAGNATRRSLGLLLLLALIPFVMRMLYVNIEIMVEYRAYNALPWVGLLAGCGLAALSARLAGSKLRWLPAVALVLIFTLLSAQRGTVWRSGTRLAENVLAQYPLNNRARTQLQSFDLDAGHYVAVLRRHQEILTVRDQIESLNLQSAGRTSIDPIRANTNVIGSYQFAILARAELEGCAKALAFADHTIASLKTLLPSNFEAKPGQKIVPAWPVLEARSAVAKALAAAYDSTGSPKSSAE